MKLARRRATATAVAISVTGIAWMPAAASAAAGSVPAGAPDTQVTATIPVGGTPVGMAMDSRSDTVYLTVVKANGEVLSVLSGRKRAVVRSVRVADLGQLAVDPRTDRIYCVNGLGRVEVISGRTDKVVATVRLAKNGAPGEIAVNPRTDRIYVDDDNINSLEVISGRTDKVTATVSVGLAPRGIAVDPVTAGHMLTAHRAVSAAGRGRRPRWTARTAARGWRRRRAG